MSGMTAGGLNAWGMTEGEWSTWGMTECLLWSLCYAPTPPHPGPLPEGEREADAPLSCLLVPLCHSRRWLAGIQCFVFLFLYSWGPAWGKTWIPD